MLSLSLTFYSSQPPRVRREFPAISLTLPVFGQKEKAPSVTVPVIVNVILNQVIVVKEVINIGGYVAEYNQSKIAESILSAASSSIVGRACT